VLKTNIFVFSNKQHLIVLVLEANKYNTKKPNNDNLALSPPIILEGLPLPIAIHSSGDVVYTNLAFKNSFPPVTNLSELCHGQSLEKLETHFNEAIKGTKLVITLSSLSTKIGKYVLETYSDQFENKPVLVTVFENYQIQENLEKEIIRAKMAAEANVLLEKEIEKHKKTQEELKRTQEISKSVFNSSIDVIISTNLDGKITEASPSAFYTFGYSKKEFYLLDLHQLFANQVQFQYSQDQLAKDGYFIGEIENIKKDGTMFTSFVSCAAIKNQNFETIGFMGISRDITDMKKAENELIKSEKRYRDLYMNLGDGIIVVDINNDVLDANTAARDLFELQEDPLNSNLYDFVLNEDKTKLKEAGKILRQEGVVRNIEFRILSGKTKQLKEVSLSSTAIYEDNLFIGSRDIIRDVTKQKEIERVIQQQKSKLESIFENKSEILIWTLDQDCRISSLNSKFKEYLQQNFQITPKIGDAIVDILQPNMSEKALPSFRNYLLQGSKGKPQQFEGLLKNYSSKRTFWLETFLSPIKLEGKNVFEMACVALDITEKKNSELQLTKSLKEKEVLLKEVHHRVKNNLQVISSILNLQSSYVKDENTLNILRESQNRVKSMSFIHESLYRSNDFSEVNFSEYINNLASNILHTFNQQENPVLLELDLGTYKLNLDQAIPTGLIVNELITNAMKYAFKGVDNPVLSITLNVMDDQVMIRIEDNGIGLPDNFSIQESDSLGLQLVTTLIEQLDGEMSVKVENGTKYLITFVKSFN
jgi:PAS domain S-box-containing protein